MKKPDHYSQTLHLPKTNFPMKARLPETEPKIIKKWNENQIYKKILNKRKSSPLFFVPDGPPYSNGPIHIGHALNKILKDIVIKYKNLKGFKAPFIPSWDCHGLPIELKTLKKIPTSKPYPTAKSLRELCRREALFWMKNQRQSFQRLAVLADWEKPCLTMSYDYEAEEVRAFARLVRKGYIYRGEKPVFWCFKLKTALAFSEAEYRTHKSPSIYVKFYLDPLSEKKLSVPQPTAGLIWTTTPWTLPANSGICLHSDLEYGLYKGEKEFYILACSLAEAVFKEVGLPSLKKQKTFKGKQLQGLVSLHPFMNRTSPWVLGEHVNLSMGTGLVHTAPGHGIEDHLMGEKYQLKAYCPVDERGHFSSDLPESLRGLFIFKGNRVIIDMMKRSKHLLSHKEISHSYPYNPRSDSPLIYRLTPQWFLSLGKKSSSGIRSQALKACEKDIHFIPSWGKARLKAMIQTSPDWCLSRQRLWGVPLVVFYCVNCKKALLDPSVIEKIADEMEKGGEGIEYYFSRSAKELLPEGIKCPDCKGEHFQKGEDILDVWFDSGIQHSFFSKKEKELGLSFPADLFLEGSDQHRGWFQTSLLSSLALNGEPPFKSLLTHGFINDKQGRKMSKSRGNVLDPKNIIDKNGAEILRLWTASENFSLDINAGEESFQRVKESYRRFRNTFRFILGNLNDFNPEKELLSFKKLNCGDRWILGQFNNLILESTKAFDQFVFHKVYQLWNRFFTVQLSAFYLDIIKDRLYTFPKHGLERKKAQTVLYHLIDKLLPLMAPVTSFLSEEAYSHLPKKTEVSVFLKDFPSETAEWQDEGLNNFFARLFPLREQLNKQLEELRRQGKIGSNLQAQAKIILTEDFISPFLNEQEMLEFFSISQIQIMKGEALQIEAEPALGSKCPRCWFISKKLNSKNLCLKCDKNLKED